MTLDDHFKAALEGMGLRPEDAPEQQCGGLMERYGFAVHHKATLADGKLHIKLYPVRDPRGRSTPDYDTIGSPARIERLYHRFEAFRTTSRIPTVPIRQVALADDGLMLIMEDVQTIAQLLALDPVTLRSEFLPALALLNSDGSWIHFDICPANVGKARDGSFCFLDLESIYERGRVGIYVSEPITKTYRMPAALRREAEAEVGNYLSAEFAERFHAFQLARLAMDIWAGHELDEAEPSLLEKQPELSSPIWQECFFSPWSKGEIPDISELARRLIELEGELAARHGGK